MVHQILGGVQAHVLLVLLRANVQLHGDVAGLASAVQSIELLRLLLADFYLAFVVYITAVAARCLLLAVAHLVVRHHCVSACCRQLAAAGLRHCPHEGLDNLLRWKMDRHGTVEKLFLDHLMVGLRSLLLDVTAQHV